MLTLVVAVPPPTGLTFSTPPALKCVSVSCVCPRRCAQILMRAASSAYTHRWMMSVIKYERCRLLTPTKDKLFWSSFCPFLPQLRKKWRSSAGSDVAVLICILNKLTNGRLLSLKTKKKFCPFINTVSHCTSAPGDTLCLLILCNNCHVNYTSSVPKCIARSGGVATSPPPLAVMWYMTEANQWGIEKMS